MSKTASTPVLTKAAFVRSLPETLSPKEVVAKAKEQGITLTEGHVSAYRSVARAKGLLGKKADKAPSKDAASAPAARRASGRVNKSEFVRSLPESLTLREVVVKAKEQGITLSEKHVSAIRSLARASVAKKASGAAPRRPGRPPAARPTATAATAASTSSAGGGGGFESRLAELVLEHGIRPIEHALGVIREKLRGALA